MRIVMQRSDLTRVLSHITKVVEPRNTMPILANVLLTAETERMTARATDLDIEITATAAATCEPGSITVNAKELLQIARKLAGDEITIELDGIVLIVKAGRSRFKLPTIAPDSFPSIGDGEFGAPVSLDVAALCKPVAFAHDKTDSRPWTNGIYLQTRDGKVRSVATDGKRVAIYDSDVAAELPGLILPSKTVSVLPDGPVDFAVAADGTKIRITTDEVVMVSKLIESAYVDYERVIPTDNTLSVTVNRAALAAATDRVAIAADEKAGRGVRLTVVPESLQLEAPNKNGPEGFDEVSADYDGEPGAGMGLQVDQLAGLLAAADADELRIEFGGTKSALVHGKNWRCVQSFMRI